MDKEQYKLLFELEDDYWWHLALRNLIVATINSKFKDKNALRILDVGCGSGGNLAVLDKLGYAVGIDLSKEAIFFSRQRGLSRLIEGSVSKLPFKDDCFDALICIDVLYHRRVFDDNVALQELYRVTKRGGRLILHLPAFEFLRGPHDKAVHTQRRYTKNDIKKKLASAGFEIKKITYRNFALFFIAAILRKLNIKSEAKEFRPLAKWLNRFLTYLTNLENLLIKNINLPLGASIFCLTEKARI